MADYNELLTSIASVIKTNNRREITGQILQNVLSQMVGSLGENYQLAGFATPSYNPQQPDQNVFYVTDQAGQYSNFDNITLDDGLSFLLWKNEQWTSKTFGVATHSWVDNNYVSKAFFRQLFRPKDALGTEILANDTTSIVDNIQSMVGLWTERYLTALGYGTDGGGAVTSLAQLTDVQLTTPIANNDVLTYNTTLGKWTNTSGGGTGTVRQIKVGTVTYDPVNGLVSLPAYPTIPTNISSFTNDVGYITSSGSCSYATSAGSTNKLTPLATITYGDNYLQYDDFYATAASNPNNALGNPTADWYYHIVMNHANSNGYFADLALCFNNNYFYYRRIANGYSESWVRVIDSDNIGSQSVNYATSASYASDLKAGSSAEIWVGNVKRAYFDTYGSLILLNTNDVDGSSWNHPALCIGGEASASHIEIDSNEIMAKSNPSTPSTLYLNAEGGNVVINESSGNCGIGVTNPLYKLHVAGTIYATGGVTALSDERHKDIIDDTHLSVGQIAKMRSVLYRWNDGRADMSIYAGSIAQDWLGVLPQVVTRADNDEGTLSLQYGVAALIAAITIARKVADHEQQIKELERQLSEANEKIVSLEDEVKQLKVA